MILLNALNLSEGMREKDWCCRARVSLARSPWWARVSYVPCASLFRVRYCHSRRNIAFRLALSSSAMLVMIYDAVEPVFRDVMSTYHVCALVSIALRNATLVCARSCLPGVLALHWALAPLEANGHHMKSQMLWLAQRMS
jgi:hypothetical protein